MNKGSKKITVRLGDELLQRIDDAISALNAKCDQSPLTRTDFVVRAICHELSHRERSRRTGKKVVAFKTDENVPLTVELQTY